MFNLDEFMNNSVDAPMDTQYPVCAEGEWPFVLDGDPKMLEVKNIKGSNDRGSYDFFQMELVALCQSDTVKKEMGRDRVPVRARINLDFDHNGRLSVDKGKNVNLGQLRDALGQNKPGWSPKMLLGAGPFIGRVKHSAPDKNGRVYADIVAFAPYK